LNVLYGINKSEFGKEIHALSCACKPVSAWTAQQIIQESREACGGFGYLKDSRLGELRNNNDPLLTFEGDNNVLLQQTSNHLLSSYDDFLQTKHVPVTPLQTIDYLKHITDILETNFQAANTSELLKPTSISPRKQKKLSNNFC
jgi:acyl-CoA oxidase